MQVDTAHTFEDSTLLLGDGEALRERAERDGYLFFKGLLPRQPLLDLRRDMLQVVDDYGWLDRQAEFMDGVIDKDAIDRVPADDMRTDIGVSGDAYRDVQKLEKLHALPHHPALVQMYRTLFNDDVLVHARHIVRMMTPHHALTATPPHQDYIHVQGTPVTWTAWFPLSDCPMTMGNLTVLRGSHRQGVIEVEDAKGAGGTAVQLCPGETDWVSGDFELGDVLTFTSLTVHKALAPENRDRIRLSLDVRYQPMSEPVEQASLKPHADGIEWEDIYRGWSSDRYQFYWRDMDLEFKPYEEKIQWQKRRICR